MRRLGFVLRTLLFGWLVALRDLSRRICDRYRREKRREGNKRARRAARARCVPIDHPAFVQPDPLIYSQYYLMKLGLAVTWDNPDIQLRRNGAPVSSSQVQPDTEYEVVARIWNASLEAPVIKMPVHFSYLDFGAGTMSVPIGTSKVDIGVKGAPSQPGFTSVIWRTPAAPGHYCLQALLDPVDDSNNGNNLGQENVDVRHAASPATSIFKLRNGSRRQQRYRFEVDGYRIPGLDPCDEPGNQERSRRQRLERHTRGANPLPDGWQVDITPDTPSLAAEQVIDVAVAVTPPDGWTGTQAVNVNAFGHQAGLVGGVTLTVVRGV